MITGPTAKFHLAEIMLLLKCNTAASTKAGDAKMLSTLAVRDSAPIRTKPQKSTRGEMRLKKLEQFIVRNNHSYEDKQLNRERVQN